MQGGQFTFVAVSGQTDMDIQATNRLVRSHVMRRYRRQRKATGRKEDGSPRNTARASSSESMASGDFTSWTFLPWMDSSPFETNWSDDLTASSPESLTCAGRPPSRGLRTWLDGEMDPFSSLPIRMNQRSLKLLQRNASSPLRTSVHADPSGIYKRICSKDAAWLYMHLYYAACRFSQSSSGDDCEATQYLLQSEFAVSNSIRQSPDAIDDSTIATVACLANIENLNGEASTAYIHMDGLKRMVQIRGGLWRLGIQGILRRMVLWSDLLTSLNLKIVPHFSLTVVPKPCELSHFIPVCLRNNYHLATNPELATIVTQKHRIELSHILVSLHQLATFLASADDGLLPSDACYADRVYEVEYAIALSLYGDDVVAESNDKVEIGQLLLQAALLYIYSSLRQTPVGGTIRRMLLSRLKALLDSMDLVYYSKTFTAEILWALMIGTSTATGDTRAEFLHDAREVCAETQIEGWIEVADVLESMPALLDGCLAACMDTWLPTPTEHSGH